MLNKFSDKQSKIFLLTDLLPFCCCVFPKTYCCFLNYTAPLLAPSSQPSACCVPSSSSPLPLEALIPSSGDVYGIFCAVSRQHLPWQNSVHTTLNHCLFCTLAELDLKTSSDRLAWKWRQICGWGGGSGAAEAVSELCDVELSFGVFNRKPVEQSNWPTFSPSPQSSFSTCTHTHHHSRAAHCHFTTVCERVCAFVCKQVSTYVNCHMVGFLSVPAYMHSYGCVQYILHTRAYRCSLMLHIIDCVCSHDLLTLLSPGQCISCCCFTLEHALIQHLVPCKSSNFPN